MSTQVAKKKETAVSTDLIDICRAPAGALQISDGL